MHNFATPLIGLQISARKLRSSNACFCNASRNARGELFQFLFPNFAAKVASTALSSLNISSTFSGTQVYVSFPDQAQAVILECNICHYHSNLNTLSWKQDPGHNGAYFQVDMVRIVVYVTDLRVPIYIF